MTEVFRPAAEWELQSMVAKVAGRGLTMEVVGHGTLRDAGRPARGDVVVTTQGLKGVTLYEPAELVMSARAGTALPAIEAELAGRGQMLPFEPVDLGPTTGGHAGGLTIGGVFATNLSGARRIAAGSARDHLLGACAVNGRGEMFQSGGRVLKNVTGLDVARALTGSWGTLAILTEVTFKVLPMPETMVTLVYENLPDDLAVEALTAALGTPYGVSGAVHLQQVCAVRLRHAGLSAAGKPLTLLRLEAFQSAIDDRKSKLKAALKVYGTPQELDAGQSWSLWSELRTLSPMPYSADTALWRISTAPTKAPSIVATLQKFMPCAAFYDWSGGLVWLEVPAQSDAGAADIRRAVAVQGGHATLIRASADVRENIEVFQPLHPGVERLTRGLKEAFDPLHLLNRGRMYATL